MVAYGAEENPLPFEFQIHFFSFQISILDAARTVLDSEVFRFSC
jgi:hypothetical protein